MLLVPLNRMDPKLEAVLDAAESQATDESVETVAEPKPAQAPSQSSSDEEFAEACESADDRDAWMSSVGMRVRRAGLESGQSNHMQRGDRGNWCLLPRAHVRGGLCAWLCF